ncbi:MAG: PAS domain S-box protein [Bacteroidota bacterium]
MVKAQSEKSSRKNSLPSSQRIKSAVASEEWFRTTLYSIGDAVITTDSRGKVLHMNPVAERLTSWKESEAQGKSLSMVFHIVNENTRKKVPNPVQRILREGIVVGLANHTLLISRDGTEYPIADAGAPIKDANGNIVGVVLVFRDQTQERNAQRAVEDVKNFAESIIATIREPLLVLDDKLEVVLANRSFYNVFQVTERETIGKKVYHLGNGQWNIPELHSLLENILPANSHFDDFEVHHQFEKIGERTMQLNARRLLREQNHSKLILLAIEDITERKKEEEKRRLAEERFRYIASVISDYAYTFRVNPDMTLTGEWVSDPFTKAFGYTLAEIDARGGWQSMVHPDDLPMMQQHALKVVTGTSDIIETRFVTRDGTVRWLRDYATPVWDKQENRVIRIYGAAQDITERKHTELALKANEERYRTIVENLNQAYYEADRMGRFTYYNPGLLFISGYTEEELRSMASFHLVAEEHRQQVMESYKQWLNEKRTNMTMEFKVQTKTGKTFWVEQATYFEFDTNGTFVNAVNILRDIDERKKTEEELLRSRGQYLQFFMENLTANYIVTVDGTVRQCNPAYVNIFGFGSIDEALATNIASLHLTPQEWEKILSLLLQKHKLEYYELQMVKRDGTPLYLIANIIGKYNDNGRLVEVRGYLFDDTRRRQLEESLRQAQKLESIGTLASGIAHDFNNILGIILGHASVLERVQHDRTKVEQSTKAITTATKRGASLVKQLLTFARKTESVFEPLDVNIIIKELSKMLYETFPRTIAIVPQLDSTIPSIIADATQIHQVLLNLCVNARDAMPKGGTLTLTTSCVTSEQLMKRFPQATTRQYVELTVSDTGIGMDNQTLSRIFEPFFTTKGVGHGTGLGLSVVHGVLGSHNGFIDVDSQPGHGTTFRLYIPAAEKPLFAEETTVASSTELAGGTETILIVEDEEYLRQALENYLSASGYSVLEATNGQEALELYRSRMNDIHLVISDIGLPQMTGDELFRQIKKMNSTARVILASGFIDPNVKSELLKSGVNDIMIKPYTPNDVLLKTRQILDTRL